MKKFLRRKIIPMFLILALILTMVPSSGITAFAADEETEEGSETITDKLTDAINALFESDDKEDEAEDADTEEADDASEEEESSDADSDAESVSEETEDIAFSEEVVELEEVVDIETDEDVLDASVMDYIVSNLDAQYSEADTFELSNYLLVKQMLVDGSLIGDADTIEEFFDLDDYENAFLTMIQTYVAVYNLSDDSDYLVAYANTMLDDPDVTATDIAFAENNNDGVELDGCIYDYDTGLAYIPKDLYIDEDGNNSVLYIRAQIMQVSDTSVISDIDSNVEAVLEDDGSVTVGEDVVDILDFETVVETETGLDEDNMVVSVNGVPIEEYEYDSDAGTVTIPYSSAGVGSVSVKVGDQTLVSSIKDTVSSMLTEAQAATVAYSSMATLPGTVTFTSAPSISTLYFGAMNVAYIGTSTGLSVTSSYTYSYGTSDTNSSGTGSYAATLLSAILNGNEISTSYIYDYNHDTLLAIELDGSISSKTDSSDTATFDLSYGADGLELYCTHITSGSSQLSSSDVSTYTSLFGSSNYTGNDDTWISSNVAIRVLYIDESDNTAIIGVLTRTMFTQEGYGIFKIAYEGGSGYLTIQKSSSNTSITSGNSCYDLAGAVYTVYTDSGCTTAATDVNGNAATLTTDSDGSTGTLEMEPGTYYIKETTAATGYELDDTVYTVEVTSDNTEDSPYTLSVTDTPGNDPYGISITKLDADTGESVAQGGASLAGAYFTITYYAVDPDDYDSVDDLPSSYTRQWVIQTVYDEDAGIYRAGLSDTCFVSGDEFYYDSDNEDLVVIPYGIITIQETKAPYGYLLEGSTLSNLSGTISSTDGEAILVSITEEALENTAYAANIAEYTVEEEVGRGGVQIQKLDKESMLAVALGAATLEGTVYQIVNASGADVVVDGISYADGEAVMLIETDEDGIAATDTDTLPVGLYTIQEYQHSTGYLLTDTTAYEFEITEDDIGTLVTAGTDGETLQTANQVRRGDIYFKKIESLDDEESKLAYIPFLVVSNTTGEWHIIMTDENGIYDSSSDYNPHTSETNAWDAIYNESTGTVDEELMAELIEEQEALIDEEGYGFGTWFYGTVDDEVIAAINSLNGVDDDLCAFPYDDYTITELSVSANEGLTLFSDTFKIRRNNYQTDWGTITDTGEIPPEPEIGTTAKDSETYDHSSAAAESVTIIDTVSYSDLTVGNTYTIKGVLMNQSTGEVFVDADGNEITSEEVTFTAESESGTIDVEFTFNATDMGGTSVVAYEYLYDAEGELVTEHTEIGDEGQTVTIIEIETQAIDEETGTNITNPDSDITIIDTVSYTGLTAGNTYTLVGTLIDKDTEEVVLDADGNEVTAETEFTATDSDGTAEVTFTFDGSNLEGGETIVCFEYLYYEGALYAVHTDLEDDDQTIYVPKIGTTATDAEDGDHTITADSTVTINDVVEYENLVAGNEYTVKGILYDKSTGEPLEIDGNYVTASETFTAEDTSGTVTVSFTFNAEDLGGSELVVFEYLYYNKEMIASHTDITDEGQTIKIPAVETGDTMKIFVIFGCGMLLLLIGAAFVLSNRRRKLVG